MNIFMCLYRLAAYQRESLTGASRLITDRPGTSGPIAQVRSERETNEMQMTQGGKRIEGRQD